MTSAVYSPLASSNSAATYSIVGPTVIAVRGPSRSGKTAMCERLVPALAAHGLRVAWMKRTHHGVDVRGKASDRVWKVGPAATALRANERLVITLPSGGAGPLEMIAALPGELDVILLETHEAVEYPTILSNQLTPGDDEAVIGRWDLFSEDSAVRNVLPRIKEQAHD